MVQVQKSCVYRCRPPYESGLGRVCSLTPKRHQVAHLQPVTFSRGPFSLCHVLLSRNTYYTSSPSVSNPGVLNPPHVCEQSISVPSFPEYCLPGTRSAPYAPHPLSNHPALTSCHIRHLLRARDFVQSRWIITPPGICSMSHPSRSGDSRRS